MNKLLVVLSFVTITACEQGVPVQSKDLPQVEIAAPIGAPDTVLHLDTEIERHDIDFDTLRAAMTRIEQRLAGGAPESEMPTLLMRLGMMKLAHEPDFEDTTGLAYVKARPAEFIYNEFHDFHAYNGHHFREIIARYPNSGLADDAAYLLTKLKSTNQECEGWVPCYLHREWRPIREFITAYPMSPLADSALTVVISTFDSHVDRARLDANYETDAAEVSQIVAGFDSVSVRLPSPLRTRASAAVARWRERLAQAE